MVIDSDDDDAHERPRARIGVGWGQPFDGYVELHMAFHTPRPVPSRRTDSGISRAALGRIRLVAVGERRLLG
jgi:hypothetical protein